VTEALYLFLRQVRLRREKVPDFARYPFAIPAIRTLETLDLAPVTILVGENGSGKSTLVEAIAVALGINAEGGSANFRFATRGSESELHQYLVPVRGARRPRQTFFLRAESLYNVATAADELYDGAFGRSLHERSHGEAFLWLLRDRFGPDGLYLLDEPESALSPQRQLAMLRRMHELVGEGSQFLMATHSPILMAYPGARLLQLDPDGIRPVEYRQTEHYLVTRDFLTSPESFLRHLFGSA